MLVLIAAMAALAAGFWLERERLMGELERVSGNVSNMHARLDSGDSDVQDKLTLVQAQVSTLFQEQEQLAMHFNSTRDELLSLVPASEDRVSAEAIETLLQQVKAQQKAASLRDAQLAALNASLDALEKSADRRVERDADTDGKRFAALNETLEALAGDVAALEQSRGALDDELSRLNALESDMRQIRQAQLAFSAQLEMLR
jgi:chromosome segregation ATPase